MSGTEYTATFDSTHMEKQIEDLRELLKLQFPNGVPDDLICVFSQLGTDIVISKDVATVTAGDRQQVVIRFSLGRSYEDFMAALRAGEWGRVVVHSENSTECKSDMEVS